MCFFLCSDRVAGYLTAAASAPSPSTCMVPVVPPECLEPLRATGSAISPTTMLMNCSQKVWKVHSISLKALKTPWKPLKSHGVGNYRTVLGWMYHTLNGCTHHPNGGVVAHRPPRLAEWLQTLWRGRRTIHVDVHGANAQEAGAPKKNT